MVTWVVGNGCTQVSWIPEREVHCCLQGQQRCRARFSERFNMERQLSLPQPVLYEPDALPVVAVAQGTPAQGHQVLVVPVWEVSDSKDSGSDNSAKLLAEQAHLHRFDQASLGALAAAIKLQGFCGKKVSLRMIKPSNPCSEAAYPGALLVTAGCAVYILPHAVLQAGHMHRQYHPKHLRVVCNLAGPVSAASAAA